MNLLKPVTLCAAAALFLSLAIGAAAAGPCYDQPAMAATVAKLVEARNVLESAVPNKGGWRAAALESIDRAIAEVRRGCAFANGDAGPR
jgi:hypothetical protein